MSVQWILDVWISIVSQRGFRGCRRVQSAEYGVQTMGSAVDFEQNIAQDLRCVETKQEAKQEVVEEDDPGVKLGVGHFGLVAVEYVLLTRAVVL
jgi:CobQ-like glutamine amidotransferase family enzyme